MSLKNRTPDRAEGIIGQAIGFREQNKLCLGMGEWKDKRNLDILSGQVLMGSACSHVLQIVPNVGLSKGLHHRLRLRDPSWKSVDADKSRDASWQGHYREWRLLEKQNGGKRVAHYSRWHRVYDSNLMRAGRELLLTKFKEFMKIYSFHAYMYIKL